MTEPQPLQSAPRDPAVGQRAQWLATALSAGVMAVTALQTVGQTGGRPGQLAIGGCAAFVAAAMVGLVILHRRSGRSAPRIALSLEGLALLIVVLEGFSKLAAHKRYLPYAYFAAAVVLAGVQVLKVRRERSAGKVA